MTLFHLLFGINLFEKKGHTLGYGVRIYDNVFFLVLAFIFIKNAFKFILTHLLFARMLIHPSRIYSREITAQTPVRSPRNSPRKWGFTGDHKLSRKNESYSKFDRY